MKNRFRLVLIFSILLLLFSVFLSLFVGSTSISLSRVLEKGSTDNIIFLSIRVPRTAAAFFAGIAFALSGLLIQKATDNSLASPNMIGINSGAGVAVLVCLSFFPSLSYLLPIAAFLGALVAVASVMLISASSGRIRSSLSIILSGVAMNALFNAAISCISALDPDALATYSNFSIGGFAGVESSSLIFPVRIFPRIQGEAYPDASSCLCQSSCSKCSYIFRAPGFCRACHTACRIIPFWRRDKKKLCSHFDLRSGSDTCF